MKRLIFLVITGLLLSQEYPALRLEEFTIIGIDTLKARRGIIDVVPGFRTSIPIPDPDITGFILDKFPVKTIHIRPFESNEKRKFLLSSFGFGYGNNLHLQLSAGENSGKDVILSNFRVLGPAGGTKGITELEGKAGYFRRLSKSSLIRFNAGIYGKWDRSTNDTVDLRSTYIIPTLNFEFAKYSLPEGMFLKTEIGLGFLSIKSDSAKNKSSLDFRLETGLTGSTPFKLSGILSHNTCGNSSVTGGKLNMTMSAGAFKSSASVGYAFSSDGSFTPVGNINLAFPTGSRLKFLINSKKTLQIANYRDIIRSAALISDLKRLDMEFFEITGGLNFYSQIANLTVLTGYRQYSRTPLLIKNGDLWTFLIDSIEIRGAVLRFEATKPERFEVAGEIFFGGRKFHTDTLLPRGKTIASFVNPEGRFLPGIKLGIITSFFGDDIVITQGIEAYKTVAGNFGAFVELTNPVKEGFETFTPTGYTISNGVSLTMGFTLKF